MIKSLKLINFQGHAESDVEFSPHVTAIRGQNNRGKSSILRALRKVTRDVPSGKGFIRDGQNVCFVVLTTDNGIVERRVKNDKSSDNNVYVVGDLQFTGSGVPVEAFDLLCIAPIQTFGDVDFDLNFQNQLDEMFLVTGSGLASIRGKVLGRITGIDKAQRVIQMASSREKSLEKSIKNYEKDIESFLAEIFTFDGIDVVVADLEKIQTGIDSLDNTVEELQFIETTRSNIMTCVENAKRCVSVIKVLDSPVIRSDFSSLRNDIDVVNIMGNVVHKRDVVDRLESVLSIEIPDISHVSDLLYDLSLFDVIGKSYQRIQDIDALVNNVSVPDLAQIRSNVDELLSLDRAVLSMDKSLDRQHYVDRELLNIENNLEITNNQIESLKRELGVCPTCGKPFYE